MTTPDTPRPVAEPISPELRRRLVELGQFHYDWATEHESDAAYQRRPADYNMHHVDMDTDPAAQDQFHARADQIMGVTGRSVRDRWALDEQLAAEEDTSGA